MQEIDHRVKMEQIREDGKASRESWTKLRRAEEGLSIAVIRSLARTSPTVENLARFHETTCALQEIVPIEDEPFVALWTAHVDDLARVNRARLRFVENGNVNAYAWPTLREAEGPPIRDVTAYATWLHEVAGHVANPCQPDHRRVKTTDGLSSCCVQCELVAWEAAQAIARPSWTRRMHTVMTVSLRTYTKYATDSERTTIDRMTNGLSFYEVQQRRVNASAKEMR